MVDDKDLKGRHKWTKDRGALFLANIGDTDQRCSSKLEYPVYGPEDGIEEMLKKEGELDLCNDASDNVQRNPKYLAPLRTVAISRRDLPAGATGNIKVTGKQAANLTRVFVKLLETKDWAYVDADHEFTADELMNGLELGVDARDVRRGGSEGWDGRANIEFTVHSHRKKKASDSVALRVAPVLTHHHGQKAQKAFVTNGPRDLTNESGDWDGWYEGGPAQNHFANEFAENVANAGIEEPTFRFYEGVDPWTQDFFETGFTSIPGPNGPVVLRIMLRSVQSFRTSGREVFHRLRSDTVGAVQTLGLGRTYDSTGNLETIPPHTHIGISYPAGRVMMGRTEEMEPLMLDFLRAQEVQAPVSLDTSWLVVGHVDEFLQFLPADNERGWVLMVDDPLAGLDIIRAAAAKDGSQPALSRPKHAYDPIDCRYKETLGDLMAFNNLTEVQEHAAKYIELNLDILKREIGLRDEDVFRVPGLHTDYMSQTWTCNYDWPEFPGEDDGELPEDDGEQPPDEGDGERWECFPDERLAKRRLKVRGSPRSKVKSILEASMPPKVGASTQSMICCRVDGTSEEPECQDFPDSDFGASMALYPSAINSVVLTDSMVLAAKQWGPIVHGVDILEEAVIEAYGKVGFNVTFQDNWYTHHLGLGQVHCGSNVWREADVKWW